MVATQKEWKGTSRGHSQDSAHSIEQETEAQRGQVGVKREPELSDLGAATFGTTERFDSSCCLLGNYYIPDIQLSGLWLLAVLQPARQASQPFYRSGNKLELSDLPGVTQETTDVGFTITFQHDLGIPW